MAEAKREKINLGWSTKRNLCKVAKGERPLSYSVWSSACSNLRRTQRERERARDLRERPMQFQLVTGEGVQVNWR